MSGPYGEPEHDKGLNFSNNAFLVMAVISVVLLVALGFMCS